MPPDAASRAIPATRNRGHILTKEDVAKRLEMWRSRRSWRRDLLGAVAEEVGVVMPSEVAAVDSRESAAVSSCSAEVPSRETGGETCVVASQAANLADSLR